MSETYILTVLLAAASLQGVVSAAECSVGSSESITEEDQPSSERGIFVIPEEVPCNGRIVSWDVCGFFVSQESNRNEFFFFATVLSPSRDNFRVRQERIFVKRNNSTANYTCFRRESRDSFNVEKGDRIGVGTLSRCAEVCPFLPVVNNTESAGIILYRESTIAIKISRISFQERTNMTIHFRAHIKLNIQYSPLAVVWIAIGLFPLVFCVGISLGFLALFLKLKKSRATRAPDIVYGVLNNVDGGQRVLAVDGVEVPLHENTAYMSYNPPETASSDPPRAEESSDDDTYDYIQ